MKTYNFIEACNSGKKFKFENRPERFIYTDEFKKTRFWLNYLYSYPERMLEIINGEFILEEKKIEITESQLEEALRNTYFDSKEIAKRLGF